jgi:hypothetical protein
MSYFLWSTPLKNLEPSQELWNEFFFEKLPYWSGFYTKWIRDAEDQNQHLVIAYSTLMRDPVHALSDVVRLFRPNETPDEKRLEQIVSILDVHDRQTWKTFPFSLTSQMRSALETVRSGMLLEHCQQVGFSL